MLKKLKLHILDYLTFLSAYVALDMMTRWACQMGAFEHPTLIKLGVSLLFFPVTGWFAWRGYTGVRDGDFYEED